jgi:hypothetical protein
MIKAAFITYNTVGDPGQVTTGWHTKNGHKAFVGQNSKNLAWGATVNGRPPIPLYPGEPVSLAKAKTKKERKELIATEKKRGNVIRDLYSATWDEIAACDHLVVYVGAAGSEAAISLAAQLSEKNIVFVFCDCCLGYKQDFLASFGLADKKQIMCECGGRKTMHKLFTKFMQIGKLEI